MQLYSYEQKHIETLRKNAAECMVLLKSDGSFPLREVGKLALYGSGARRTIKGGTGSGDVNVRHFPTIEEGLENAGFTITTKSWLHEYDTIKETVHQQFVKEIKRKAKEIGTPAILLGMGAVMPEPEYELPLNGEGAAAIYVLARVSGEGSDRTDVPGDFQLTETEIRDILTLSKQYERFLLVLNVGGVVDLTPVNSVENILLLSQTGITIGDSFADVLLGKSYPSGRLASTWAGHRDYCGVGDFAEQDDTRYKEGIYVGYRYFDTLDKKPLFPFGYGMGYTTFSMEIMEVFLKNTMVTVRVLVKNTGTASGKEVVQAYVSVPSQKLDQPYQTLAAFTKTKELKSGEEHEVTLDFRMEELASFDSEQSAEILEKGDYILRIGRSSRETTVCAMIRVEEDILIEKVEHVGGVTDFEDWTPDLPIEKIVREREDLNLKVRRNELPLFNLSAKAYQISKQKDAKEWDEELIEQLNQMSDQELAYLCLGAYQEQGSQSIIGNAGMAVAGAAGETTGRYAEAGIPPLVMADGPAGLRLNRQYGVDEQGVYEVEDALAETAFADYLDEEVLAAIGKTSKTKREGTVYDQYCSAIPIGTALAQSWNIQLCEECADVVGDEMERFGVHLWLAPALNIHRSPLCGRNYEYYSEDPLISGKMAAAITRGVQKHPGCGVTIKHFVCNNQETNRFYSNSIVNERALRDIYMRGFRIAIEEGKPYALMTSYNLLNGEHTCQRMDILKQVLRNEWNYEGLIMSDWFVQGVKTGVEKKYPYACASGSIKAGNHLMMPGGVIDYEDLINALNNPQHLYSITRKDLMECAYSVGMTARKLGRMVRKIEKAGDK